VSDVNPKRAYASAVRQETARQTRQRILDAARELFLSRGYVATSVDAIANAAGVAKPTVFAAVGSKRVVLERLRDLALAGDDEPVPVAHRPWYREALEASDPHRVLRLHARNVTRIAQRVAALDLVLERAAGADPDLTEVWGRAEQSRRIGAGYIVDAVRQTSRLRPGLTRERAIDILWTLTGTGIYDRLTVQSGWSNARYETWLADLFTSQLLPMPTPPTP